MVKTDNFQLRYANCWEDTAVLLKHIDRGPGAHYLSIAPDFQDRAWVYFRCLVEERN